VRSIVVDTGAIVARLNKRERFHEQARALFNSLRLSDVLLTTWPVITEASFLIRTNRAAL
jgi:predicted nucleic acid-binding protein